MPWTPLRRIMVVALLWSSLLGCTPDGAGNRGAAPLQGSGQPVDGAQTAAPDDPGWRTIDTAMELRTLRLTVNGRSTHLTLVRFDPASYSIRVKYDVANAGSIRDWFNALKPVAVINGGYFDRQGKATALVIFDGIRVGESYTGFGGMVVINEQGQFELRSLRQQAFNPNENLQQAMQSSPMLIQPGGVVSELEADQDRSRRSVIARDQQGRILLIVSDDVVLTLRELAAELKRSDLQLDAALNLDGGRSTGLYVATETARVAIDSFDQLPLVLVVQRP